MSAKQQVRPNGPEVTTTQNGNGDFKAQQAGSMDEHTAKENINEIREILFGNEMRWHEQRFAQIEDRLLQETSAMKQEQTRRFDALDQQLAMEVKSLNKRLDDFAQQTRSDGEHFQQCLETQGKDLTKDIRTRHAELTATLREEIARLGQEMTDRQSLAELLHQLADRLQPEQETGSEGEPGEA